MRRDISASLFVGLALAAKASSALAGHEPLSRTALRRHKRQKPKPYVARIDTAQSDERDDKYLHAAARRRQAEHEAAKAPPPLADLHDGGRA